MTPKSTQDPPEPPTEWSKLCFSMFDYAPLPIAAVEGGSHLVRYVNPAFCRLIEKPQAQVVGKRFDRILPENNQAMRLLDRVFHTGQPENHSEEKDSKPHPLFWSYTVWPVMTGNRPIGVVVQVTESADFYEKALAMNEALMLGTVRQHELTAAADSSNALLQMEISERKLAEKALQLAQALLTDRAGQLEGMVTERTSELMATNQQLEAFVYSIAHDLRAPLRAMQGFSTLLVEEAGPVLNNKGNDYAQRISKAAQFMDNLLTDLLDFSRISQQRVDLTPVKLETVIKSVLSRLQKDIQEKNARVENAGPWPVVMAHEPTLVQVLFNLVSNALKFVSTDESPLIQLRTEERADFIRVWVVDKGPGIEPRHQAEIFRLFTRLDGEKYPGTGIGLAIVQKGVQRMGGAAGVKSTPGQGSDFWFEVKKAKT
jgi:signal transduction histidine kinase